MKNALILLVTMLFTSCMLTKNGKTKTLKLVKADKHSYALGIEMPDGKSSGISYSMYFENKVPIKVQKVWINGININFEQVKTSESGSFRIRSTFYVQNKKNQHPNIKEPIVHDGKALLEYLEGGDTKYYVVKDFLIHKPTVGK